MGKWGIVRPQAVTSFNTKNFSHEDAMLLGFPVLSSEVSWGKVPSTGVSFSNTLFHFFFFLLSLPKTGQAMVWGRIGFHQNIQE